MDEHEFLQLLDEIEEVGATSIKETLLKRGVEQWPDAEEFLRLTYNDTIYGLAEKTFYNIFPPPEDKNFTHVSYWLAERNESRQVVEVGDFHSLKQIADKVATTSGMLQQSILKDFFSTAHPLYAKWYSRVLLHDLYCGVQVKTVNNVFKTLGLPKIPKFAVQLAEKLDPYDEEMISKKITFPCSMEMKYDGYRIQAEVFPDGKVTLMSRRGNDRTDTFPEVAEELGILFKDQHIIFDGEMVADSFQKLTRKDDKSDRKYVIFDLLNDEKLPYISRWDNLFNLLHPKGITVYQKSLINNIIKDNNITLNHRIFIAEHYSAANADDIQEFFADAVKNKEEGIMVKLDNRPYSRGSRKNMFKCKKVYSADLLITGYALGDGKRAGLVGALQLRDKTGLIKVDVGSGFDDDTCVMLTKIKTTLVGKICEILYNEITETGSLRHPRFVRLRDDKDEPDSFEVET